MTLTSLPPLLKRAHAHFAMTRPSQIGAVLIVALTGTFIGATTTGYWPPERIAYSMAALILVAASIHTANEYADYDTDQLTQRTAFSGGSGAWLMGVLRREDARRAGWMLLLAGLLGGGLGIAAGLMSMAAYAVLLTGAFWGWMYSVPPLKLAWRGWGEVTNALLGTTGLMMYGDSLVTGVLSWSTLFLSLPFAGIAFVNLLATTYADKLADQTVGKFTLATQHSTRWLRRLYTGAVLFSAIAAIILLVIGWLPEVVFVGWGLILPLVGWGWLTYTRQQAPHPSVYTMIGMMIIQAIGWLSLII